LLRCNRVGITGEMSGSEGQPHSKLIQLPVLAAETRHDGIDHRHLEVRQRSAAGAHLGRKLVNFHVPISDSQNSNLDATKDMSRIENYGAWRILLLRNLSRNAICGRARAPKGVPGDDL